MRIKAVGLAFLCTLCLSATAQEVRVRIQTEAGSILVAVNQARAPVTAANFLQYVDRGFYNGGEFHRTVRRDNQPHDKIRIAVIQAGINPEHQAEEQAPITLERTTQTGLHHRAGTISMARDTPESATSEFFICVTEQPSLDYGGMRNPDGQGFAAFGRVIRGMAVVRRIQMAKASRQALTPPIKILSVSRVP